MGDWNVAPRDEDVWDIDFFDGRTHVTQPERSAFEAFAADGWVERRQMGRQQSVIGGCRQQGTVARRRQQCPYAKRSRI